MSLFDSPAVRTSLHHGKERETLAATSTSSLSPSSSSRLSPSPSSETEVETSSRVNPVLHPHPLPRPPAFHWTKGISPIVVWNQKYKNATMATSTSPAHAVSLALSSPTLSLLGFKDIPYHTNDSSTPSPPPSFPPSVSLLWLNETSPATIKSLEKYHFINQIFNVDFITRKVELTKRIGEIRKKMKRNKNPNDYYNYYPMTFILPQEKMKVTQWWDSINNTNNINEKCNETDNYLIIKPESSAEGKGIYLVNHLDDIKEYKEESTNSPTTHVLVQKYIPNPLLLSSRKFDLRIYVLILSLIPFEIYIYNEGIVRLSSEEYQIPHGDNQQNSFIHLTNYAVNKKNVNVIGEEKERKRKENGEKTQKVVEMMKRKEGDERGELSFNFHLDQNNKDGESKDKPEGSVNGNSNEEKHQKEDDEKIHANSPPHSLKWLLSDYKVYYDSHSPSPFSSLFQSLSHQVVKTLLLLLPSTLPDIKSHFHSTYPSHSQCFQLLGFDFLIDDSHQCHLIEINRNPSLRCDSEIDRKVKGRLIEETMRMVMGVEGKGENEERGIDKIRETMDTMKQMKWRRGEGMEKEKEKESHSESELDSSSPSSPPTPTPSPSLSSIQNHCKTFLVEKRNQLLPSTLYTRIYPIHHDKDRKKDKDINNDLFGYNTKAEEYDRIYREIEESLGVKRK